MGQVVPQANNAYSVTGTGETSEAAMDTALRTAAATCKERNMRHIVSKHATEYKGNVISESHNDMANKVLDFARPFAGFVPSLRSETDYKTTMDFTCQI